MGTEPRANKRLAAEWPQHANIRKKSRTKSPFVSVSLDRTTRNFSLSGNDNHQKQQRVRGLLTLANFLTAGKVHFVLLLLLLRLLSGTASRFFHDCAPGAPPLNRRHKPRVTEQAGTGRPPQRESPGENSRWYTEGHFRFNNSFHNKRLLLFLRADIFLF